MIYCPICKNKIIGYPALSRKDNFTEICSECGMKEALEIFEKNKFQVGDFIKIEKMDLEPQYKNRTGYIKHIDDAGQLHGTWGGLAIVPETDRFKVYRNDKKNFDNTIS